jgi:hypothetical protein
METARHVLMEIYGWFTTGFDTAELQQEARALRDELGEGRGTSQRRGVDLVANLRPWHAEPLARALSADYYSVLRLQAERLDLAYM